MLININYLFKQSDKININLIMRFQVIHLIITRVRFYLDINFPEHQELKHKY